MGQTAAEQRAYRARNPEKWRNYERAYYKKNREKIRARQRARYAANSEEINAKARAYREANRDKWRSWYSTWWRGRAHGLTVERFTELFAAQGNQCAYCDKTEPGGTGWHVDHDPTRGCHPKESRGSCDDCRRGIACHACNTAIGMLGDSSAELRRRADHLEIYERRLDERQA